MKIVSSRQKLSVATTFLGKIASGKLLDKSIEGVKIVAEDPDVIKLFATNSSLSCVYSLNGTVEEAGETVIDIKLLSDIGKKMSGKELRIESNEENVYLKSERSEFCIHSLGIEQFPELDFSLDGEVFEINSADLKSIIDSTVFSTSKDESRPILTGCLFEFKQQRLLVVALDGFRIALRKVFLKDKLPDIDFVVPFKILSEMSHFIKSSDEMIKISYNQETITFFLGTSIVSSKLIEGQYVNYQQILPKEFKISLNIDRKVFLDSVERNSLLLSNMGEPIKFTFSENNLRVFGDSSIGTSSDDIAIEYAGEELTVGFNPRFLKEALKAIDEDRILLKLNTNLTPLVISSVNLDFFQDGGFLYLILPVRIMQ